MQNTRTGGGTTAPTPRRATGAAKIVAVTLMVFSVLHGNAAQAQDVNNGKVLYNTPLVTGERSCSNGACHGPDPLDRQNRIQLGENPGNIVNATNSVAQMAFLRGRITTPQLIDLAAYIADPTSATGQPVAQVSPSALNFGAVAPGTAAPAQQITVSNTGTSPLSISSVSSSSSDFGVNSNCGVVAINTSCTVNVTFAPPAAGPSNATVTILHNASGGSSTVSVTGIGATAVLRVQPSSLNFPAVVVGTTTETQSVEVANDGNAPLTISSVSIVPAASAFIRVGGTCDSGTLVAAGTTCNIQIRATPTTVGPFQAQLVIAHSAGSNASVALNSEALSDLQQVRLMVEYRYAPLDYYFITSRDADKIVLDAAAGWARTGFSFPVFAGDAAGRVGISRYYFDKVARGGARGSHFYTLVQAEKLALNTLNPTNVAAPRLPYNEGVDSFAFAPTVEGAGGSCASGQLPVFRLFRGNAKFPDDPNHRFTASTLVYNQFVALGWDGEGVKFCVPAP